MKRIVFFNNKGGVGKTSLVYHLAWMYEHLGLAVVAADLDPQANLTAMFLDEDRLVSLWPDEDHRDTVLGSVQPLLRGTGDVGKPHVEQVADRVNLVVGDLGLSRFEDALSDSWPRCLDGDERAFRVMSAFYRMIGQAGDACDADIALVDVGPNLGAINRAAIIAADYVVIPLGPDLFSMQGLRNLGPTLRKWRTDWSARLSKNPVPDLPLPTGKMDPAGYVVVQAAVRLDRPVRAYARWIDRMPAEFHVSVLGETDGEAIAVVDDPNCLASLKHYHSLMPLSQEARKPMFDLSPADGAIGSHAQAAKACGGDFRALAQRIAERCEVRLPEEP